ncbi:MAG: ATPase [Rhizobiaceae bacterium]|nr:ATPase [Rhizobiaceae bacterium]
MRDDMRLIGEGHDPVKAAQAAMRPSLPKRFYKTAEAVETEHGFAVHLDGRTARTPARNRLFLPSFDLARRVAAEWAAQGDAVDPMTMPLTRIINPAIDAVGSKMGEVRADIVAYAGSDLLCYRAGEPETLVNRQHAVWDPVLRRAEAETGARFLLAEGVVHVAQGEADMARFASALERATTHPFTLAATHVMTTLTGSALLALSVAAGWLEPQAAWHAAHLDEDWTNEHWGVDAEAADRRARRERDFVAAAIIVACMRDCAA